MNFSEFKGTSKQATTKKILLGILLILVGVLMMAMTVLLGNIQQPDDVSVAARQGDCIARVACNIDQFCSSYLYARYFADSPSVCPPNFGYCACDNQPIPDNANQSSTVTSSTTTSSISSSVSTSTSTSSISSLISDSTTSSSSTSTTSSSTASTTPISTTISSTSTTPTSTIGSTTTTNTSANSAPSSIPDVDGSQNNSGVNQLPNTGIFDDNIFIIGVILVILGGIFRIWSVALKKSRNEHI